MKKSFCLTVPILMFFTSQVYSQTIGVNSGIIASNLYVTTKGQAQENWLNNYKLKIGYSLGITLIFKLPKESLSIETGVTYANLGSKYNLLDDISLQQGSLLNNLDQVLKLHYILLPVLLRYKLSENFNLKIGPQFGYLFDSKTKSFTELASGDGFIAEKKVDFGINIGMGYTLNSKFDISLNLYNGFGKVEKRGCIGCSEKSEANSKNRYIGLSINYILREK
jgi:hypothetical protein